jgi:hypothetical protein
LLHGYPSRGAPVIDTKLLFLPHRAISPAAKALEFIHGSRARLQEHQTLPVARHAETKRLIILRPLTLLEAPENRQQSQAPTQTTLTTTSPPAAFALAGVDTWIISAAFRSCDNLKVTIVYNMAAAQSLHQSSRSSQMWISNSATSTSSSHMNDALLQLSPAQVEAQQILRHLLSKLKEPESKYHGKYGKWVERHPRLDDFCLRCIRPQVWSYLNGRWSLDAYAPTPATQTHTSY